MTLTIYKKGQGTAARGLAGIVAVLLGTWAAHQVFYTLHGASMIVRVVVTAIVAGIFVGVPVYLILFHHQVVDILIETQQEMKKVAWSSRQEVLGATAVVLFTVAVLAVFIFVTDQIVIQLFRRGLFKAGHLDALRVDAHKNVADGAVLAASVRRLQHDEDFVLMLGVEKLLQRFQALVEIQ